MINQITTLSRERLEQLADENTICKVSWDERIEIARALLAVMDAKPVAFTFSDEFSELNASGIGVCRVWSEECYPDAPVRLYTTPPAPSAPDGWKLVPVEPTIVMTEAAIDEFNESRNMRDTYYALLEHAPTAPGQ